MALVLKVVILAVLLRGTLGFPVLMVRGGGEGRRWIYLPFHSQAEDDKMIFNKILRLNRDSPQKLSEGDIALRFSRSAWNCPGNNCYWPKSSDGTIHVPYTFSLVYSVDDRAAITTAMQEFATMTCIRFIPRMAESNYLQFTSSPKSGCWSYIGMVGGVQALNLEQEGCLESGIIQHELFHALGFIHENNRSDRDTFIQIQWQYISERDQYNFKRQTDSNNLGLPYDYNSLMHMGRYSYTNTSGMATIVPIPDPDIFIGQRYGLSNLDVAKINKLYKCNLCRTLLSDPSGRFSFNASLPLWSGGSCLWLMRIPSEQSSPGCFSNYLAVYDGDSMASPVLLARTCALRKDISVVASSYKMLVEFSSDGSNATSYFSASYSSVICGGTLTSSKGVVTSPNFPSEYPPSTDCTWAINAPLGYKIYLSMNSFQLEDSTDCAYDYLTISASDDPLRKYCGYYGMLPLLFSGTSLTLKFHSDEVLQFRGFNATYCFRHLN
ncbi:astacin-like metalloendopeptidase isoform X2 [Rhinatrema bivittatum]|uniref:astacin-like metalloendopeptidase isoform X2 n=1 Tax=Rhinatrema bivittatum TaxID=194408 RepID=UPI00112DF789|nr:astacin-like metalloendopeptidase isoform X2 [Rhinatrema bivittatum]